MCISSNKYTERNFKLNLDELVYNKTFEEEMEEQRKMSLAIDYLRSLGVEATTEEGYYRASYNILKDLGESLAKNNE